MSKTVLKCLKTLLWLTASCVVQVAIDGYRIEGRMAAWAVLSVLNLAWLGWNLDEIWGDDDEGRGQSARKRRKGEADAGEGTTAVEGT